MDITGWNRAFMSLNFVTRRRRGRRRKNHYYQQVVYQWTKNILYFMLWGIITCQTFDNLEDRAARKEGSSNKDKVLCKLLGWFCESFKMIIQIICQYHQLLLCSRHVLAEFILKENWVSSDHSTLHSEFTRYDTYKKLRILF